MAILSERQVRHESVLEEQKTVDAVEAINQEIHTILLAKLAEMHIDPMTLRNGDVSMYSSGDGRCKDIFYKRKCLIQLRTEVKTDGSLRFNLFYEPINKEALV